MHFLMFKDNFPKHQLCIYSVFILSIYFSIDKYMGIHSQNIFLLYTISKTVNLGFHPGLRVLTK